MKYLLWSVVAVIAMAALPTTVEAADNKPIDTKSLVVKPTKAVANLTAATINMAGQTAANQIDKSGYVKTLNNLLRKPTPTLFQPGPSPLPVPSLFPSTRYPNYNTPVMPVAMPSRR